MDSEKVNSSETKLNSSSNKEDDNANIVNDSSKSTNDFLNESKSKTAEENWSTAKDESLEKTEDKSFEGSDIPENILDSSSPPEMMSDKDVILPTPENILEQDTTNGEESADMIPEIIVTPAPIATEKTKRSTPLPLKKASKTKLIYKKSSRKPTKSTAQVAPKLTRPVNFERLQKLAEPNARFLIKKMEPHQLVMPNVKPVNYERLNVLAQPHPRYLSNICENHQSVMSKVKQLRIKATVAKQRMLTAE
jgi:hypothetical protein